MIDYKPLANQMLLGEPLTNWESLFYDVIKQELEMSLQLWSALFMVSLCKNKASYSYKFKAYK